MTTWGTHNTRITLEVISFWAHGSQGLRDPLKYVRGHTQGWGSLSCSSCAHGCLLLRRGLCSPWSSRRYRARLRTRGWRGRQATQRTVGAGGSGRVPTPRPPTPQPPTPRDAKNEGTETEEHPCSFCCVRILRFPGPLLGASLFRSL